MNALKLKIVITGSYAAGKTQFIRSISDIDPVSTDYDVTPDDERELKHNTTVALDFGTIAINERVSLYLFGTPGQERFHFMWDDLANGAVGIVVLADVRAGDGGRGAGSGRGGGWNVSSVRRECK